MYGPYDHGWMFGGGMGMMFGGIWMILSWIVFLLLIIALLKYLFSKPQGGSHPASRPGEKTAIDLLKEAYALGEISREEYLQKRDDLLEK